MTYETSRRGFRHLTVLTMVMAVLLVAAPSFALTVNLVALPATAAMPGSVSIPMWGFALDTGQPCTANPAWGVGPTLSVAAPETSLTINLRNCLPEPVSMVIPGQPVALSPVKFTDPKGRQRARSFTAETAPGAAGIYTWNNLKPGTYLYQSGSHPAVQVQMGLYGAMKVEPGALTAYPGVTYDSEVILFYSEIDRALHDTVAAGKYGSSCANPPCTTTSTIDYKPDYFLINGQPFQAGQPALPAGDDTHTTLVRFLNAGLRSHAPTLLGSDLKLIAEDGNSYPYPREQYSLLLAAGKTIDALWTPSCGDTYKIYDHTLHLTTGGQPDGGMLAYLQVGGTACSAAPPENLAPVASNQGVALNEDALAFPITLGAADADGDPLTFSIVAPPTQGILSGTPPNVTYSPAGNYNGPDSFTFKANDGTVDSNVATVSITVNPVNDAPSFTAGPNQTVALPAGAQTVSSWATNISPGPTNESGQTVSFLVSNNSNALFSVQPAVSAAGTLTYTPSGTAGSALVTVRAQDSGGVANGGVDTSGPQTFTITVSPAPAGKHVGDLDWTASNVNSTTWQAQVTITVHDQSHNPLSGVTVNRSWTPAGSSGGPGNTLTCTTNAAGQCTLARRFSRTTNASATFAVTSLTGAGGTYQPSANHDPDVGAQASNGTSVTVPRP